MAIFLQVHPDNPNPRHIRTIVDCLLSGGVIIYPTDTVYALGCSLTQVKALDRMSQIRGEKKEKTSFSVVCHDLKQLSDYARPIENDIFKLMKRVLPGPYTFILEANNNVPKIYHSKKKSVGIRVPDNKIASAIVLELGSPLASTSLRTDLDDEQEYIIDPELIYERYDRQVDIVVDGGFGDTIGSTILDCTDDHVTLVREGKGEIKNLLTILD